MLSLYGGDGIVVCFLISFIPCFVGWLVDLIMPLRHGYVIALVVTLTFTVCWFLIGRRSRKVKSSIIPSLLCAHGTSIISLIIYTWQFVIVDDTGRNMTLAVLSQYYSLAAPLHVTAKLADLLSANTLLGLQIASLLFLIVVFLSGQISSSSMTQF